MIWNQRKGRWHTSSVKRPVLLSVEAILANNNGVHCGSNIALLSPQPPGSVWHRCVHSGMIYYLLWILHKHRSNIATTQDTHIEEAGSKVVIKATTAAFARDYQYRTVLVTLPTVSPLVGRRSKSTSSELRVLQLNPDSTSYLLNKSPNLPGPQFTHR